VTDGATGIAGGNGPLAAVPRIWMWGILAVVLAVGVILRLVDLPADPPLGMTWSHAPYTDGARIVEGARTQVLQGTWETDPENPVVLYYPISSLLAYGIFRVFGVGLWQANLTGAIPGIVMLLLLFWVGSRRSAWVGLGASLLAGLSFYLVTYNRLPMSESLMLALMLAVPALLLRDPLRWWQAGLAGVALAAAALFVKFHALVLLPVALVWLAFFREPGDAGKAGIGRSIGVFGAGFVVGLGVWLLAFLAPRPEAVADFLQHNLISQYGKGQATVGIAGFLGDRLLALVGLGTNVRFFGRMPVVGFVALLTALAFALNWRSRRGPEYRVESFFSLWFLGAVVALSFLDYRPLRYHLQMIPPMAVLCSLGLVTFLEGRPRTGNGSGRAGPLWVFAFSSFIAFQILMEVPVYMGRHGAGSQAFLSALGIDPTKAFAALSRFVGRPPVVLLVAVLAAAASAGVYAWVGRGRRGARRARTTFPARVVVVGVLVALSVMIDVSLHRATRAGIRHSLRDVSLDLGRILGEGGLVVGTTATTLTLDNRLQSLPAYGRIVKKEDAERLRRHPVTHIMLRDGGWSDFLKTHFPEVLEEAVFLRRYVIGPSESSLFRVEGWPGSGGYQPTAYERGMGALADGDLNGAAADLQAFLAEDPDEPSALFGLGLCMEGLGRPEDGIELMQRAVSEAPEDLALLTDLGAAYARLGRVNEAVDMWRRVLLLNPRDARARSYMGTLQRRLQRRS